MVRCRRLPRTQERWLWIFLIALVWLLVNLGAQILIAVLPFFALLKSGYDSSGVTISQGYANRVAKLRVITDIRKSHPQYHGRRKNKCISRTVYAIFAVFPVDDPILHWFRRSKSPVSNLRQSSVHISEKTIDGPSSLKRKNLVSSLV